MKDGTGEEPPADEDGLASRHLSPLERPTWANREEGGREGSRSAVERVAVGPWTGTDVGLEDELDMPLYSQVLLDFLQVFMK